MRSEQKSHKKNALNSSSRLIKNKKLYRVLLEIYKFSNLKDLFILKEPEFAHLCDVNKIHWYFNEDIFKNESLLKDNFQEDLKSITHYSCSLNYKNQIYGELIFIAPKITKTQGKFLQKIGDALSSSLHFIQNKKRLDTLRKQWEFTFDSFHKAFCITDNHFHVLKFNKAFVQLIEDSHIIGKDFFNIFPFPINKPLTDGLWVSKGKKNNDEMSLEFTSETLYLKNERFLVRLIKVTDVTEKIKMQKKIEKQSRQRELGLIKASVAHELNNPLAGIKTLLHLISHNLSEKEDFIRNTLEEMDEALKRCQDIIQNLLHVSRSKTEETEATPKP